MSEHTSALKLSKGTKTLFQTLTSSLEISYKEVSLSEILYYLYRQMCKHPNGCTDPQTSSQMYGPTNVLTIVLTYEHSTDSHPNPPYTCPMCQQGTYVYASVYLLSCSLFKANVLHLKALEFY